MILLRSLRNKKMSASRGLRPFDPLTRGFALDSSGGSALTFPLHVAPRWRSESAPVYTYHYILYEITNSRIYIL